jgi:hypothetical protein
MSRTQPNPYAVRLLMIMNLNGYPMYQGTANPNKVAKRRAKNRVAKQSRKRNRG